MASSASSDDGTGSEAPSASPLSDPEAEEVPILSSSVPAPLENKGVLTTELCAIPDYPLLRLESCGFSGRQILIHIDTCERKYVPAGVQWELVEQDGFGLLVSQSGETGGSDALVWAADILSKTVYLDTKGSRVVGCDLAPLSPSPEEHMIYWDDIDDCREMYTIQLSIDGLGVHLQHAVCLLEFSRKSFRLCWGLQDIYIKCGLKVCQNYWASTWVHKRWSSWMKALEGVALGDMLLKGLP